MVKEEEDDLGDKEQHPDDNKGSEGVYIALGVD